MSCDEKTPSHEVADRIMFNLLMMRSEDKIPLAVNVGYEVWALLKMLPFIDHRVKHYFVGDEREEFMGVPLHLQRELPEHEFKIEVAKP